MEGFANLAHVAFTRFTSNIQTSVVNMSPEKWIRIAIVLGTYMLLRPWIITLGKKSQMQSHEAEGGEGPQAKISPNDLRGKVAVPEDTDDEDGEELLTTSADWGKKARRRQRKVIKDLLAAEEKRLQESREEEEDKDIEEFLVKE